MSDAAQKVQDTAIALKQTKAKKGVWPWVVGIGLVVVMMVSVYLLKKKLGVDQKELAKLRTAAEQQRITAAKKKYQAQLEMNDEKAEKLRLEAMVMKTKADKKIKEIQEEEKKNAAIIETLESISSWEELDTINDARP